MQKEQLYIIKIGGHIIDDKTALYDFLKQFSKISSKKILVHGGGKIATVIGEKMGIKSKYIDGRRITDGETIDLVTMVYGGLVNKKIVALLHAEGCNAIGLTGADANIIPAKKRAVNEIDFGWVGDVNEQLNTDKLKLFLENGLTPVLAPLTHDSQGNILNTNADTIASVLAKNLSRDFNTNLIFCFEKSGVLNDINDEQSLLDRLTFEEYSSMKSSGKLFAGVLPKIDNAFDAVQNGVANVVLGNASELSSLINGTRGTKFSMK